MEQSNNVTMAIKIYTRTGDKGQTSLFGGKRVSKASERVDTYGTVDELNSVIGVAISQMANLPRSRLDSAKRGEAGGKSSSFAKAASFAGVATKAESTDKQITKVKKELEIIQRDLLLIGSYLSSPGSTNYEVRITKLKNRTDEHEVLIDELTEKLPELRNFILPGGGKAGAQLHFARTVCRRTERLIIALSKKESVDTGVIMYFNRLSDLLFTMARFVNHKEKKKETIWSQ